LFDNDTAAMLEEPAVAFHRYCHMTLRFHLTHMHCYTAQC
jgi:hypothetical protein